MPRRLILIAIALFVAVGAVFLSQLALKGSNKQPSTAVSQAHKIAPPTQVLVTKTELFAGDLVKATDLAWQDWPDGALPASYEVSTKSRLQDFVGSVVTSHMGPGDPVTAARLVKPNDRSFMAAVLQPGDRAVTVNVTPASGQAGFLFPGDRVDLILTSTVQAAGANGASHHVSETILRGIRIVGLDQTFSDKRDDKKPIGVPRTATLEVTPKQAEIVSVASDLGVLSLALDSVAEPNRDLGQKAGITKTWDTEATQIATSAGRDPAERSSAQSTWVVDIVRGGATVEKPFPLRSPARGEPGQ